MSVEEQGTQEDSREIIPEPKIEQKHEDEARRIAESYDEERPSTVLPGSDGTISGTAVADWIDEDQRESTPDQE